ncbi:MAG: methyltransferase [bacterium]|nr:methyltransferase [bacterium]
MSVFRFKQFSVTQEVSAMKVSTDAMLLGSLIQADHPNSIIDIGTGTGVVALMMAQRFQEADIKAIEIDQPSAEEADQNFCNSPWNDRLSLIKGDFRQAHFDQQFDLIVSNPPYYQSRLENNDARKSQARHESALPMKEMLEKVADLLSKNGSFWVIVPSEIENRWINSAIEFGLDYTTNISILGKEGGEAKRNILSFRNAAPLDSSHRSVDRGEFHQSLTIRNADGTYTQEYIELTKEFHYNKFA